MLKLKYEMVKVMNILVAVPTYKRAFLFEKNRGTIKFLKEIKETLNVRLFLKKTTDQIEEYKNVNYDKVYIDYEYAAELRYQIIKHAINRNYTHLILLDDDLNFFERFEDNVSKCRVLTETSLKDHALKLIWTLAKMCNETYPLTGIPFRKDMRVKKYLYEKNSKLIQCVCMYLPVVQRFVEQPILKNIRFKSDYCLQLFLLSNGYRSITYNNYCIEDGGQNSQGGCQETRSIEELEKASRLLYNEFKHTGNIKLRLKKTNNTNWEASQMVEVSINWKKFLSDGELPYLHRSTIE